MKDRVALIIFRKSAWFWDSLIFMLLAFKKATAKTYSQHKIGIKTLWTTSYLLLHWNISK